MRSKSDTVRKSSYVFIEEFRNRTGKNPTGILFNKFMVRLNRLLLSEGVDIRLPHCWYRWGDEVVRYSMPYLDWEHTPSGTFVSFGDSHVPKIDYNDRTLSETRKFAISFIKKYSGQYGHEEAVDETYSEAPYEFQNRYRMLRESLKISRQNKSPDNYEEYIGSLFNMVKESYPKEFDIIRPRFDDFSAVFDYALDHESSREDLFDLCESFWFFCYYLRLDKKCHANVSEETLNAWREVIPYETDIYDQILQNTAASLCEGDGSVDPTINKLLETRRIRLDEINKLLSELY